MHLTAAELVRCRNTLIEDLEFHIYYQKLLTHTYAYLRNTDPETIVDRPTRKRAADILRQTEIFQVTSDMCSLIHHASLTIPNEDILPESFLSNSGFLWLDDPIVHQDIGEGREDRVIIRDVVVWHHTQVASQNNRPDLQGMRLLFYGLSSNSDIQTDINERTAQGLASVPLPNLAFSGDMFVPFGENIREGMDVSNQIAATLKWILAFGIIARQPIATIETPQLDRATRRARIPPPPISIVSLRRRHSSGYEPGTAGHRDWQQRWVVSGGWRQQPYGPGRSLRRTQWIPSHIKGPDDKPLIIKPHVRRLS